MVENIFGYNNCGERQGNRLIKNIRKWSADIFIPCKLRVWRDRRASGRNKNIFCVWSRLECCIPSAVHHALFSVVRPTTAREAALNILDPQSGVLGPQRWVWDCLMSPIHNPNIAIPS
jgi:hypothetical protein